MIRNAQVIFLLLFPVLLGAQNISVQSFQQLPDDMDARVSHSKMDQNGEVCAIIKVVTSQQGFSFEGDMNGIVATEQKIGEYWVYVPHASKSITLKHPQLGLLRKYNYPVPVKEATVYEMMLTTGRVVTSIEQVEKPMQWLIISSEPDGADVFINNEYIGTTPFQKKLEVGQYNYRLEKAMYHSTAGLVHLIENNKETLHLTMNPGFGYVHISTLPENGAMIQIDGQPTDAKTPYTSKALKSGKHQASLKLLMYKPRTVDFEVLDNQTTELKVELESNFADVEIRSIAGADIFIDDEKRAVDSYAGRLMPGLHTIEVQKEKHYPERFQVDLVAGESRTFSLLPLPKTGNVDIITTPFGATIKIDGKLVGESPETFKDMLIGKYTLSIEKDGYETVVSSFTVQENQTITVEEILTDMKKVTINSTPSGLRFFIDGAYAGTTPKVVELKHGTHTFMLKNLTQTIEEEIEILPGPNQKTVWSFNLEENILQDRRDGQEYKTVQIGLQIWMAENLKYSVPGSSWKYDDKQEIADKYGLLYTWDKAMTVCPEGWHLPTLGEWNKLTAYLRGNNVAGGKLKENGTKSWNSPNIGATNQTGFTALPGGNRYNFGTCTDLGETGNWWTATEKDKKTANTQVMRNTTGDVRVGFSSKNNGLSVRCVKD